MFSHAFLELRLKASEYVKAPIVSALATVGALLELLSILPASGAVAFYAGAVLVGLSCGWLVVVWMSSFRVADPDRLSFVVSPDLVAAVGFYFGFRVASSVSPGIAEGFLLALPLVAIACMPTGSAASTGTGASCCDAVAREDDDAAPSDSQGREIRRVSMVLVCVSAVFALISSILVHMAGKDCLVLAGGMNYMVLFELLMVAVVLGCCYLLHWLAGQKPRPRGTAPFTAIMLCVPAMCVGLAMGAVYEPENVESLIWEASFWVMLVAVFAYDLRSTLYLGEGLAVGLMFESMCMGQTAMQLVLHVNGAAWTRVTAIVLLAAYLAGVFGQLLGMGRPIAAGEAPATRMGVCGDETMSSRDGCMPTALGVACADGMVGEDDGTITKRCGALGALYGLTLSETRILVQVGRGRSARYIADDMGISFNTVRTHIRHVYEKMGIHSKQELIDLIELDV